MARTPLIAGNWKMNLNHLEAIALVQKLAFSLNDQDLDAVEVVVLPPFTDIRSVQTLVDGDKYRIGYGAQDVSPQDGGAYTGDISGPMLAKLGCSYVLAGHSERRQHHGEDDAQVNAKVRAILKHKMRPILCVGEDHDVRSEQAHLQHTTEQLRAGLADVTVEELADVVVAYEPVWAIGTGAVATPEDAQEVSAALRGTLAELYTAEAADKVRILYGGSVKADNAAGILDQSDIDGSLVGGASLDAEEFVAICRARQKQDEHVA